MNKQQKSALVESLRENITGSQASFIVGYKGLSVGQMQALREQLREKGGALKVAKARLMKRAVDGVDGAQDLTPHLHDQIGLVFATQDCSAIAKVLSDFAKENQGLLLNAGLMESRLLTDVDVKRIASLPSREILLAQVCGALKAPTGKFVNVLNMLILRLLWTLKAVADKKQQ